MAKTSAAQQRAVHKYVKNNYDRLELSVPKGEKVTIQQAAKQAGQSVNAYIYEAVCARMQQENATSDTPGVVKNLEPGVILAERKGCLFSPVRGKIWWLFGENTLQQRKRHSMLKSDASFCLSRKVFPDEISPRLHLLETLRVGQNRYIRQMFESKATRHYNPQW